ncbi:MAG: zf-HC2 domain-containing protein [Chitinispirillales bacterium]|jgi:anti-sigma factor RsiW|nr:zf-HC2 domain-containing protein [Chitinispirillales bacterium]
MVCDKFGTIGLLYASGELSEAEAREYRAHLGSGCPDCAREAEAYRTERAAFYTVDILGEDPSPTVDAEILRVCANPKALTRTTAFMPMVFIKKYAAAPIFVMLIAVAIGVYVRHHSMNAADLRAELTNGTAAEAVTVAAEHGVSDVDSPKPATADSAASDDKTIPRTRGNLNIPGVHTVSGE